MKQVDLADAVGVRPQTIQHYLNGGNASYRTAEKLARITGTDISLWAKGGLMVSKKRRVVIAAA
jgi:transcriptional regulator with XRE-family HTH domain